MTIHIFSVDGGGGGGGGFRGGARGGGFRGGRVEVAEVEVDSGVKRSKNSRYVHVLKYNLTGKIIKHW